MSNNAIRSIYSQANKNVIEDRKGESSQEDRREEGNEDAHLRPHDDSHEVVLPEPLASSSDVLPSKDDVDLMKFQMRNDPKIRMSYNMYEAWKKEIDEYSFKSGIDKQYLVAYAIGKMLGKM